MPIQVVHEDADLLVLDKPSGLLSVPGKGPDKQDCLSARVQAHFPDALVVHRLDMATSGLMLMARGPAMQRALSDAFATRTVTKRYSAVVAGKLQAPDGQQPWNVIDLPIALSWKNRPLRHVDADNGKPSITRWQVCADLVQLQRNGNAVGFATAMGTAIEFEKGEEIETVSIALNAAFGNLILTTLFRVTESSQPNASVTLTRPVSSTCKSTELAQSRATRMDLTLGPVPA